MKFGIHPAVLCVVISGIAAWPSLPVQETAPSKRPRQTEDEEFPFIAPQNDWARSPCPGTNMLANHGFINRDGRNVTADAFRRGFRMAFNLGSEETFRGTRAATAICGRKLGLAGRCKTEFSLDMLNDPHDFEHDASLSRNDYFRRDNPSADNFSFNSTIWNLTLDIIGEENSHVNMRIANTMRMRRVEQAQQEDIPGEFIEEPIPSLKENAFLLAIFNDPERHRNPAVNPLARKDWIHYFFVNERLPTDLGWQKPTAVLKGLDALATQIGAKPTIPAKATPTTSSNTQDPTETTSTPAPTDSTTTSEPSSDPTDTSTPSPDPTDTSTPSQDRKLTLH